MENKRKRTIMQLESHPVQSPSRQRTNQKTESQLLPVSPRSSRPVSMNATSIARPSSSSSSPRPMRGTSRGQESEEMAGAAALLVGCGSAKSATSIAGLASSSSNIRCTYIATVEESHLVAVDTSTEATARVSDRTAATASKKTATIVRRPELLVITDTSGTRSGLRPKRVPSFDTQRG